MHEFVPFAVIIALLCAGCGDDEEAGVPTPPVVSSSPEAGAGFVPETEWLILDFATTPDPASAATFELICDGERLEIDTHVLDKRILVNPRAPLPNDQSCELRWLGLSGRRSLPFRSAPDGPPALVTFDRDNPAVLVPFPEDSLLAPDAGTATGKRVDIFTLARPADVSDTIRTLSDSVSSYDGFSPLGPWVIEITDALDPETLPTTLEKSLDPLSTVMLFDIDPESPDFGQQQPFYLVVKDFPNKDGTPSHQLIVFPATRLEPTRSYGLIVTRRATVDPSRPLDPSPFFSACLGTERASPGQLEVGALTDEVMAAMAIANPWLRRDDVALALKTTVRSMDDVGADLMAVREQVQASPLPSFTIDEVVPEEDPTSPVAAQVAGTWAAPRYWTAEGFLNRDADGVPLAEETREVPFTLVLPRAAATGPVPIVMVQHGNPGSAEGAVPTMAYTHLAEAGYAVIGFTQLLDRLTQDLGPGEASQAQLQFIFESLLTQGRFPDLLSLIPNAEQLGFVRLIQALEGLDVLPVAAPDGQPDLAVDQDWLYMGVSYGASNGLGFLPFAPEFVAGNLVVGGGRYASTLFHQDGGNRGASNIYEFISSVLPNVTRSELYAALSLTQMSVDDQDWSNRAHLLRGDPFDLGVRTNILMTEGLADTLVPAYATQTAAAALGLAHVDPIVPVPFLEATAGPVESNLADGTTGGLYQYVPSGLDGFAASAGCSADDADLTYRYEDGHACGLWAFHARAQRIHFFDSALAGSAEIISAP